MNQVQRAKRNLKNRLYRERKKSSDDFWNRLNYELPNEIFREIMSYSPLPGLMKEEAELEFLLQNRRKIFEALKRADTATIYRICKFGFFSKCGHMLNCEALCEPYKKYPSFCYDPSGFWMDDLDIYYSHGRKFYKDIRPEIMEVILQLISSKEKDTMVLRKRMLAISADLRIL